MEYSSSCSGITVLDSKIVLHCSYSYDVPYSPLLKPCSCWVIFVLSIWFPILEVSQQIRFFCGPRLSASCPTRLSASCPTRLSASCPTRLSASCPMPNLEDITFDLSDMGDPTCSHATAYIALRIF